MDCWKNLADLAYCLTNLPQASPTHQTNKQHYYLRCQQYPRQHAPRFSKTAEPMTDINNPYRVFAPMRENPNARKAKHLAVSRSPFLATRVTNTDEKRGSDPPTTPPLFITTSSGTSVYPLSIDSSPRGVASVNAKVATGHKAASIAE